MNWRSLLAAATTLGVVAACSATESKGDVAKEKFPATYLNDKVAVAFFSTQTEANTKHGYVAFIKDDNTIEVFDHQGLDVGRLADDGRNSVLVADRNTDTVIGANATSTPRGRTEHVGFFAGWVPEFNGYLSLFNSGQQDNAEGYAFNLEWYNSTGHHAGSLPYYLEVAGICDGVLFTSGSTYRPMAKAPESWLLKTTMTDTASTEIVATWPTKPTTQGYPVGRIFCDGGAAHYMYQAIVEAGNTATPRGIYLNSVDLKTGQVKHRLVKQYSDRDEAEKFQTWFPYRSTYMHDGAIYYVDGQGRVYSTDLSTGDVRQDVVLDLMNSRTLWPGVRDTPGA